jgi:hypothetical protein
MKTPTTNATATTRLYSQVDGDRMIGESKPIHGARAVPTEATGVA